jgi:SNF2 family DNA or RNA helicase
MYAFDKLKDDRKLFDKLDKSYPYVEVFCDPLNENKITWYYPDPLPTNVKTLIERYFKNKKYIESKEADIKSFLSFITESYEFENICIRPEVVEKVERAYESSMLRELERGYKPDYSMINAELFPYQKDGVEFALFKKVAIIADEMGLGKTIQAVTIAALKKKLFDFKKTLIICPATLKSQWKKEIEKFTEEKALIISGTPDEREVQYFDDTHYFLIANYEMVLRDTQAINKAGIDFLILDEAQRVKNYETKTASSIKRLLAKHTLIITGTPIENRLIDIFSVVSVLDPYFFGPLWEFSYQHCLFDSEKINKINGYYNLQELNQKLSEILIRREKRNVLSQLPSVQQFDIPIALSPEQDEYHSSYARGIASILKKKFITAYDMQKLQLLLSKMRMVCNSTYLVDEKTNVSPKLVELEDILFRRLDLNRSDRKIIIFSEWVKMHKLIARMLRKNKIGFAELNGKVPVKLRGDLIKKFENDPNCKIFLSTEAGGAGLNLQVADVLINFELPWNPAKKNQRIGRIDRLGQMSESLTIFNLITQNSIEQQIAVGLLIKQSLFEGVLDSGSNTDYVDFSSKGRSQFIEQLEAFVMRTEEAEDKVADYDTRDELAEPEEEFTEDLEPADTPDIGDGSIDVIDTITETAVKETVTDESDQKTAELEQVMTSGMQFLAGLFKMSTGKDMGLENQQVSFDKETGEITMKFKLPM